ncbi:hypothetical protein [Salinactinospora qingdaonensis]|uniref:Uncharacterized protein n=1 Tax=Salinactinospora qingdaonensis TaxID=702744 RepID=A0ABP7F1G1_9ACTN
MGLIGRKASAEALRQHAADEETARRLPELLEAARQAEHAFHEAQRDDPEADTPEVRRLSAALDTALTDAMRAAYAKQRALIGPRGYDDRIYRRKRSARPEVKEVTSLAESLLTLRERHRLHGPGGVLREPVA